MKSRTDNISSEVKTTKGFAYDSRWMIISVIALALFLFCLEGRAQLVSSNPMEYVALAEGNELINSQIKNQIEDQQKTALLQNTIAAEFTQIRQWERKYNSYLKTVSGYASTLKACSHLYDDGVRIFINLCDLKKAISQNTQGIVATMSMNNLYIETATELVTVYSILKDAVAKNTIAAEFTQIRQWERKYNSYLKTVSGYASTLKACSHLYDDGVRIFINLCDLKKAISQNTQGIVATMSMNNLYIETATELVTVYSILKDAVAKGGASNMLTGAERSKILWELNDRLAQFNKRLSQLSISIRYYTMADVWNNATAGMLDRNTAEIAGQALDRWHRCARTVTP